MHNRAGLEERHGSVFWICFGSSVPMLFGWAIGDRLGGSGMAGWVGKGEMGRRERRIMR